MELRLDIDPEIMTETELKEYLESGDDYEYELVLRGGEIKTRILDPTVLVALVGAAGTGLGALITGLCKVAAQGSAQKITIQGRNGERLEFPASLKPEEIDKLVEQVRALNAQAISIP